MHKADLVITNLPKLDRYARYIKCGCRLAIYTHIDSLSNSGKILPARELDFDREIVFVIPSFGRSENRDSAYLREFEHFRSLIKSISVSAKLKVLAVCEGHRRSTAPVFDAVCWENIEPLPAQEYLALLKKLNGVISLSLQHKEAHQFGVDIYRYVDCIYTGLPGFASWVNDAVFYGYTRFELGYLFGSGVSSGPKERAERIQLAEKRRADLVRFFHDEW